MLTFYVTFVLRMSAAVQLSYLKVDELAVLPPECLPLPDHHGGHHLLAELGLPLLDGGQHHVPTAGGW